MLDLITIAIILVFVFFGFKKGVARTALTAASTLLSIIVSVLFSKPIAESIYESSIKPALIGKMDSAIKSAVQADKKIPVDSIINSLPSYVKTSLPNFNITNEKLYSAIRKGSDSAEALIKPIILSFTTCIVALILFIAIWVIAKIIISIVCDKMDVITKGLIDSFFGSLVGLAEGFLIVIAVAFILRISIPHMENPPEIISDDSISHSFVFRGIYDSPILREVVSNTTFSPNVDET